MREKLRVLLSAGALSTLTVASAFAEGLDFSSVSVDMTPIFGLAVAIVSAIVVMIPIRKSVKLGNRS